MEAKFKLAEESRLPKWFTVSDSLVRRDFTVEMEAYSTFSGWETIIKLYKKGSIFPTDRVVISSGAQSLIKLHPPSIEVTGRYPIYNAITVNGITDIVEHKKMEPIFYMTDDPVVWEELVVKQENRTSQ